MTPATALALAPYREDEEVVEVQAQARGVECARVEDSDHKNASSTYAQLREHLNGEKRCYPVCRQGHCYLVRVKK
jgi:hypothetical protein